MAEESSLPVRERLLAAAAVLFYEQGIAATGIDSITKRAGVAKQSLYNHFASKAELVAAYLQVRHQEWLDLYAKRLQAAATPQAGVLAVFAAYQDHAERAYEHGFRGCGLLNAAADLPEGVTFSRGETGDIAALLREIGSPLTPVEIDSFILDNCHARELEFEDFFARAFALTHSVPPMRCNRGISPSEPMYFCSRPT